jgi:hypothetical protein
MRCPLETIFESWNQLRSGQLWLASSLQPLHILARTINQTHQRKLRSRSRTIKSCKLPSCHHNPPTYFDPQTFTHLPLHGPKSIRLFELEPGNTGDPIRGRLVAVEDLAVDCPEFCAWSYTWGGSQKSHQLYCDGVRIAVTCNLYSALVRFRDTTQSRLLFIDALCIDQSGSPSAHTEKETQIQLMREIYPAASYVVVDLGDEADNCDAAIALLELFCTIDDVKWEDLVCRGLRCDDSGIPGFHAEAWSSLMLFCAREWFSRTWTVQEYALAREIKILVGTRYITPLVLSKGLPRALRFCGQFSGPEVLPSFYRDAGVLRTHQMVCNVIRLLEKAMPISAKVEFLNEVRQSCQPGSQRFPLSRILFSTRGLAVSRSEDAIRGVLGMCRQEDFARLTSTVPMSSTALSEAVTQYLLDKEGLAHLLYHQASYCHTSSPSWQVDLELQRSVCGVQALNEAAGTPWRSRENNASRFCAGGDGPMTFTQLSPDVIQVEGCFLDTISWCSKRHRKTPDATDLHPQEMAAWYGETWREVSTRLKCASRRSFGAAVVAGGNLQLFSSETPAEELYLDSFDEGVTWINQGGIQDEFATACEAKDWRVQATTYAKHVNLASGGRRIVITSKGYLANVPGETGERDLIAVLVGGDIPFVLRRSSGDGAKRYRIVGTAYVEGFMYGEALKNKSWRSTHVDLN